MIQQNHSEESSPPTSFHPTLSHLHHHRTFIEENSSAEAHRQPKRKSTHPFTTLYKPATRPRVCVSCCWPISGSSPTHPCATNRKPRHNNNKPAIAIFPNEKISIFPTQDTQSTTRTGRKSTKYYLRSGFLVLAKHNFHFHRRIFHPERVCDVTRREENPLHDCFVAQGGSLRSGSCVDVVECSKFERSDVATENGTGESERTNRTKTKPRAGGTNWRNFEREFLRQVLLW